LAGGPAARDGRAKDVSVLYKQLIFYLGYKAREERYSHIDRGSIAQISLESQGVCRAHKPREKENG